MKKIFLTLIAIFILSLSCSADDEDNTKKVVSEIKNKIVAAKLNRHLIEVEFDNGHVILDGIVSSKKDKLKLEQLAAHTPHVKNVKSNIRVGENIEERGYVAEKVFQNVHTKLSNEVYELKVSEEAGAIILTGSAENKEIKEKIEKIAIDTEGVTHIKNYLIVRLDD